MRYRAAIGVVVAIAVGAIIWYFASGDDGRGGSARPPALPLLPDPADPVAPMDLAVIDDQSMSSAGTREPVVAIEAEALVPVEETVPTARVFGRVVDVDGLPLASARISMHAVGEPWLRRDAAAGEPSEEVPDHFEAETGSDGRFELNVPIPTSDWIALMVRPDEFHGLAGRDFGLAGGRNAEPLRPGDNDLGEFVLVSTGAIAGVARDANGAPLEGALASLDGSFPGGFSANGKADADGRFRIAHVPAGEYAMAVSAKGYVSARKTGIVVRDREVASGGEVVLERAPTLSGVVVDERGAPVAGVRLQGWPASSGTGAGARSAEDGSFVMFLPQAEPYRLEAEREGYETFAAGRGVTYAPGTSGIRIELHRPILTRFSVRTAGGEPVERFGLKIIQVATADGGRLGSSSHVEPAEVAEHPGGDVALGCEPKLHEFTLVAPGFAPMRGPVDDSAIDAEGMRHQTIVAAPAASICGRLLNGEAPVAWPTVRIERDRIPIHAGVDPASEDDVFSDDWTHDLDEFAGRVRLERGAADGTFCVDDLAPGTYELTLSAPGGAPLVVDRLRVQAGERRDLGDLFAAEPAELSGVVRLPQGVSPAGIVITTSDAVFFGDDERAQTLDTTGRFRFQELGAGRVFVQVEPKSGVIVAGEPFELDLEEGERREVVLDLTARVPCRLEVRVALGGEPAAGLVVQALHRLEDGSSWSERVGLTDDDGICRGAVRADGAIQVRATSRFDLPLADLSEAVDALPGDALHFDLSGGLPGRLVATLPDSVELRPGFPSIVLLSYPVAESKKVQRSVAHYDAKEWTAEPGLHVADLGPAAPGTYGVSIQIQSTRYVGEATVVAGETARIDLKQTP